ncbi:MBL fold metallo-hydrolase [Nocardia sp. bgisy134]|uniref:MBL fold metallo-hydrolase n=1 Tax=Nocardia sp. bgisy134 TaxID=3413789 RepID=UPI003D74D451
MAPSDAPAELVQIGQGTWALLRLPGSWGQTNTGLIAGADASVVIDTPWDERRGQEMMRLFEPHVRRAPIESAVITHGDADHWWGSDCLPSHADIISSEATLEEIKHDNPPRQASLVVSASRVLSRVPVRRIAHPFCIIGEALAGVQPSPEKRVPSVTFTGKRVLSMGGRALQLREEGPAHTAGDVIVYAPDVGVVFGGDLLFLGSTPVAWHGPLSNWIGALERMMALEADTYVPGHGPLATKRDVGELAAYWQWITTDGRACFDAGLTPLEAGRRLLASPDGRNRWASWLHPERIAITLHTAWREWLGRELSTPTLRQRVAAFSDTRQLQLEFSQGR